MKKCISLLGSTGSIGTQALDTVRRCGFSVASLSANTQVELLAAQARAFDARLAVIADKSLYPQLRLMLHDTPTRVLAGMDGLCEAASMPEADLVCNALVGMVGIRPTEAAIRARKTIALANKETIVSAGDYILRLAEEYGVSILPVDSEHSAFFQCMEGRKDVTKLLLTASGGPFFGKTRDELRQVSDDLARTHPNWRMGPKVTVDSATLMNKGLELIEAVRMFRVPAKDIEIIIHRESIVHAMVELTDGSVMAYMSAPTMELPIQYALTYPERLESVHPLSLTDVAQLSFFKPDEDAFASLRISRMAAERGGLCTTALNGGNEAAVELFLQRKISFAQLLDLIDTLGAYIEGGNADGSADSLEAVLRTDAEARAYISGQARQYLRN